MEDRGLRRRSDSQPVQAPEVEPVTRVDDGLSPQARSLFQKYQQVLYGQKGDANEPKVKVGSALSSLAFFYERFRNTVDYREDHVLLRNSIERITKRLLWENPSRAIDTAKLAESLVKELIWAKYIKNETLPESRLEQMAAAFSKYLELLSQVGSGWRDWLLGVCAGEIEEIIKPEMTRFDVLTEEVTNWFIKRYDWEDAKPGQTLKKVYLWAAIYRSLFKADLASLRYHLLKRFFHGRLEKEGFVIFARNIENCLNSKEHLKLYRIMQRLTPSFIILSEVAEGEAAPGLLADSQRLAEEIDRVCEKKYSEIRGRVARGITRSIIYIFITKMIFALLIEIPYEVLILKGIRYLPVALNLSLPPLLMFMVGLMIKRPGENNTKKISERIFDFIYGGEQKKISFSLAEKRRRGLSTEFFEFGYALFFVLILGLISYGLYRLNFSLVSALIFFIFLSLVLLFGFRVKHTASEYNVAGEDEEFFSNVVSLLFLPFLNIGYWLSSQLAKLNFLVLILDFLIEAPLKSILAILEDWNIFMKEKRRDMVDTPSS